MAKKREWYWYQEGCIGNDPVDALWAIVERLEALVEIGDSLEEVGDLWANSLAFGGQPVGGIDEPVPATRGVWMCDRDSECVLMKGHNGNHLHKFKNYCQCVKPEFNALGYCTKCTYPREEVSDATTA